MNSLHGMIILFFFSQMAHNRYLFTNIVEPELKFEIAFLSKALFGKARTYNTSKIEQALKELYDKNFTYIQIKGSQTVFYNFRLLTGLVISKQQGMPST